MDNHSKISAILIVYHEEAIIERCLKSLKEYVDEIIVIHDGPCQDNTLAIAQKYTSHIHEGDRKGMMEFHLINAIQLASYDWILRIDADEYLSPIMGENLHNLIKSTQANSFAFFWPIWDGSKYVNTKTPKLTTSLLSKDISKGAKHKTSNWQYKQILFRKSAISYIADPHSNFIVPPPACIYTPYTLEHKPLYNNYSWKSILSKQKRWALVHAKYTRIPLSKKETYNFDISQVTIWYLLTRPRFALRYSIRRYIPEIILAESIVFLIYYLNGIIFRNLAKQYYYKVLLSYKVLHYLAMRKFIR